MYRVLFMNELVESARDGSCGEGSGVYLSGGCAVAQSVVSVQVVGEDITGFPCDFPHLLGVDRVTAVALAGASFGADGAAVYFGWYALVIIDEGDEVGVSR